MEKLTKAVGATVLIFAALFGWSILMAFPTKWMVNYLLSPNAVHSLFGVSELGMWQGFILNMLTGFLFRPSSK